MDHVWVCQNQEPHHPYVRCSACGLSSYEPMPKGGCDGNGLQAAAKQQLRQREAGLRAQGAKDERARIRKALIARWDDGGVDEDDINRICPEEVP